MMDDDDDDERGNPAFDFLFFLEETRRGNQSFTRRGQLPSTPHIVPYTVQVPRSTQMSKSNW